MSKIKAELIAASALKLNRGEAEPAFLARVVVAIGNDISDETWSGISGPAQDWNNVAADALKLNKELPAFPDAEAPAAAPTTRRRAAAAPAPEPVEYEPTKGDEVTATSKRNKVVTGFIVEITDDVVVVNPASDGPEADDIELPIASNTFVLAGAAEPAASTNKVADELAGLAEPEVGDTVEVVTKREKIIVGNIEVLEGDDLVLKDAAGTEHELSMASLKSVKVKVKNAKSAAAPAPAPVATGRGRTRAAAEPAAGEAEKKTRSSNPAGVSLGGRIRELMCGDESLTVEQVSKKLTDEGINFRDTSVKMIRKDVLDVIAMLRQLKKIK